MDRLGLKFYPGPLKVAADNTPNVRCPECGDRLTWQGIGFMLTDYGAMCLNGHWFDAMKSNVEVLPSNAYLLERTPRYWWHVTYRQPWTPPNHTYVHIGTPETVRWLRANYNCGKTPLFTYRVELKSDTKIHAGFAEDENRWPIIADTPEEKRTAIRYLNRVEKPGTISLLVPFGCLTNVTWVDTFKGAAKNSRIDYRDEVYK